MSFIKKVAVSIHAIENFNSHIIKDLNNLDFIHIDVMDGKFVSNVNNNLEVFKIMKENYSIPIIAHLMVNNPFEYIDKIIEYIEFFIFHLEIKCDKLKIINEIKQRNKKVGIAINPDTEIGELIPYLNKINLVLVMSVYPGWSGQKFIKETIEKVHSLALFKNESDFEIDVDGGINLENAKKLVYADILSSSSTILNAEDPNLIIESLKNPY